MCDDFTLRRLSKKCKVAKTPMELAIIWVRAMLGTKSAPAIDGGQVKQSGVRRVRPCPLCTTVERL
jgi:hypothetical protein